jgi:ribosomal protein L13
MKKTYLLASIAAVVSLATSVFAKHDDTKHDDANHHCVVINADKVNVLAAGKADGVKDTKESAGKNKAKEEGAWINLDKKDCDKLNEAIVKGDAEDAIVKKHAEKLDASLIAKKA